MELKNKILLSVIGLIIVVLAFTLGTGGNSSLLGGASDATSYINLTSSGAIKTGQGTLRGFYVATAATTPLLSLHAGGSSTSTVIIASSTVVGATYYDMGNFAFTGGLWYEESGAIDVTFFFD